ncbi:MAG: T9SS type A sorting domain-containing protein [Flavobacteriales bacterium]
MRSTITILLIGIALNSFAQYQFSQSVVASSGNYAENAGYSLQSTTGEMCAVETFQNGYYLTQGFQQGLLLFTGVEEMENNEIVISIYPNPVSDAFSISLSGQVSDLHLEIFDITGQVAYEENVASLVLAKTVDVKTLAGGTYLLRMTYTRGGVSQSTTLPFIIQQ